MAEPLSLTILGIGIVLFAAFLVARAWQIGGLEEEIREIEEASGEWAFSPEDFD